jgi:glucuronyl/N-acetylglucosaminyl transferase EXT1
VLLPSGIEIRPDGTAAEHIEPGERSYVDMLFNSTFALLPRACGYALSYRMVEAMNAGCVPVIISDGYVLPFSEYLDYESFSIRIAEADVEIIPEILAQQLNQADQLQKRAYEAFLDYFSSTERIINHAIRLIQRLVKRRYENSTSTKHGN